MADREEDPQRLKKIAAAAYDYENDPRWADYWSNILIPPHMASRSDVREHFKRNFEIFSYLFLWLRIWSLGFFDGFTSDCDAAFGFFLDPELVVEAMSTGSSSSSSSSAASEQPRARNSGSATRTSGASATSGPTPTPAPTSMRWDRQTIQFSVNAWVECLLWLCWQYFQLYLRIFQIGHIGYHLWALHVPLSILCTHYTGEHFYSITSIELMLSFIAVALIPILCRAVEHVAKFLRRNFTRSSLYRKYLEEPCVWVESNATTLSILSSHTEIGLGFLLILSLLSWQRNIIQTFMYWQLLKLMYHAPVTASYHQSVWSKIGRTINPLVHRYAPFLNTPISAIQRWWFR
uniref:Transmembrane protein 33-like n=1 Tax=Vitis vinifera TaxID=29760 RepID=A5B7Q3_VITVI|nr:hypothetical protein VITISV_021085 [Vitis vinifera]